MKKYVAVALAGIFPWALLFFSGAPWERGFNMAFVFALSVILSGLVSTYPFWEEL